MFVWKSDKKKYRLKILVEKKKKSWNSTDKKNHSCIAYNAFQSQHSKCAELSILEIVKNKKKTDRPPPPATVREMMVTER